MPFHFETLARVAGLLALFAAGPATAAWDDDKGCLACHAGIERFADGPVMAELACTFCHAGDGTEQTDRAKAHRGLVANPADLRVVERSCGACHAEETERVRRSLHASSAGIVGAVRRAFGAAESEQAYAARAVDAGPTDRPSAVARFLQLPRYDPARPDGAGNTPADDYLRGQCLSCHLWNYGEDKTGSRRASGCAACHVAYSDAGTYEGGDRAIDRRRPGRPRLHRLAARPAMDQCLRCHNRPDGVGRNYVGGTPGAGAASHGTGQGAAQGAGHDAKPDGGHGGGNGHGHGGSRTADVHYQRGLVCLDCHGRDDLHGDGYLYRRMADAVSIRCASCHGTPAAEASLATVRGDRLANLVRKDGRVLLTARDGKEHVVPQLKGAQLGMMGEMLKVRTPKHLDQAECAACHAQWAPECGSRTLRHDLARAAPDWLADGDTEDPSAAARPDQLKRAAHPWEEVQSPYRWNAPPVAVGPRGKLTPQVPDCRVTYAPQGGASRLLRDIRDPLRRTFQPHSTSRQHQRHCVDCHCRNVPTE